MQVRGQGKAAPAVRLGWVGAFSGWNCRADFAGLDPLAHLRPGIESQPCQISLILRRPAGPSRRMSAPRQRRHLANCTAWRCGCNGLARSARASSFETPAGAGSSGWGDRLGSRVSPAPPRSPGPARRRRPAASGAGQILDIMRVKPGCVITDITRPMIFSKEEVAKRPDVLVIRGGEILLPWTCG